MFINNEVDQTCVINYCGHGDPKSQGRQVVYIAIYHFSACPSWTTQCALATRYVTIMVYI